MPDTKTNIKLKDKKELRKIINDLQVDTLAAFIERLESLKKFRACINDSSTYVPSVTMQEIHELFSVIKQHYQTSQGDEIE